MDVVLITTNMVTMCVTVVYNRLITLCCNWKPVLVLLSVASRRMVLGVLVLLVLVKTPGMVAGWAQRAAWLL